MDFWPDWASEEIGKLPERLKVCLDKKVGASIQVVSKQCICSKRKKVCRFRELGNWRKE